MKAAEKVQNLRTCHTELVWRYVVKTKPRGCTKADIQTVHTIAANFDQTFQLVGMWAGGRSFTVLRSTCFTKSSIRSQIK
jgi:hypothetical protein